MQDGNGTNWSDSELRTILAVWRGVAEDYAPFDVDVTTQEPVGLPLSQWVRAAIGESGNDCESRLGSCITKFATCLGMFTHCSLNALVRSLVAGLYVSRANTNKIISMSWLFLAAAPCTYTCSDA